MTPAEELAKLDRQDRLMSAICFAVLLSIPCIILLVNYFRWPFGF